MGYTLVKKESLEAVADTIRQKGGTTAALVFPDGFIAAINALESAPETPTAETLTLAFVGGDRVSESNGDGTYTYFDDYVCVGHTSGNIKDDAVWSFTPGINASSAVFKFSWDNSIGSVGYSVAKDYAFYVTTDGESGRTAASASNKKVISVGGSGTSGTVEISVDGLSLVAGTTYYIRANYNGDTKSTLKAFARSGNTVQLAT